MRVPGRIDATHLRRGSDKAGWRMAIKERGVHAGFHRFADSKNVTCCIARVCLCECVLRRKPGVCECEYRVRRSQEVHSD